MIAFSYIRVSGKGQCDGDGPDRQRDKISDFIKGMTFGGEYFEQGVSGTVEGLDRPAFVEMLSYLDGRMRSDLVGPVCIVVERMDRLARDLMVQELLLSECRKRGIKVYAADQGLVDVANDEGNPTQTLVRQIMGAIAQWEKSVIVMKLRGARERKKRETGRCEGPLPYGQNEQERKIIWAIFTGTLAGYSFSEVAAKLNAAGHRTRTNKLWNKARVAHVYQNNKKERSERTSSIQAL